MSPIAISLIILSSTAFFAWAAQRRYRLLATGAAEAKLPLDDVGALLRDLPQRLEDLLVYALGQKKMPGGRYQVAGIAHALIFAGFNVLIVNTVVLWGRGFDPTFDLFGILKEGTMLANLYWLAKDTFLVLVILGCSVFIYYRIVTRQKRMTLGIEGLVILGIIITMMVADILYSGARMALAARTTGDAVHFHFFEPAGSTMGIILAKLGLSYGALHVLEHIGFWWHATMPLVFLNLLPFSKHFHVITSLPNVLGRDLQPAALPPIKDLEGRIEREESVGIATVRDLSWKHILDLYTCTECGRCSDNCPAYTTDKVLSPKHLTLALRDHLYESELALTGDGRGSEGKHELHTNPPAPAGAYTPTGEPNALLINNVISADVIWACTTCRACEEQCPVMISYVDKIVGMRRYQVTIQNEFPAELLKPFNAMQLNGNPWNYSSMDRGAWADGLGVPLMSEMLERGTHPEALYWVGCAASFDDRAKKIARDVAKLLQKADVDFAILGTEETCTGDPARRAGNEFLFQMLAQQNVDTLNRYGVAEHKTPVITTCPHCFNTLLNEYPQLGGKYEVVHHTDFLLSLLSAGKLKPTNPVNAKIAYHDSCYLGRYNDIYEAPREILSRLPGVELVEVAYANKKNGLCCGAGGAQMFMEEQNHNRVNKKRTLQLLDTGAQSIATACPFCMTMITDGLKDMDKEATIPQMDVAEFLARSAL